MNPLLKYTLARLGLFVVVAAVLLATPIPLDPLLRLGIALIVSALASFWLLRGLRDQVAGQLAAGVERRRVERARLQAALSGTDQTDGTDGAVQADRTGGGSTAPQPAKLTKPSS